MTYGYCRVVKEAHFMLVSCIFIEKKEKAGGHVTHVITCINCPCPTCKSGRIWSSFHVFWCLPRLAAASQSPFWPSAAVPPPALRVVAHVGCGAVLLAGSSMHCHEQIRRRMLRSHPSPWNADFGWVSGSESKKWVVPWYYSLPTTSLL